MNEQLCSNWSIKIRGRFFDSYIYAGKLYLATMDYKIRCVHWDRLITGLEQSNPDERLGLYFSFEDSSALYAVGGKFLTTLASDPDIRNAFIQKVIDGKEYDVGSLDEISQKYNCLYEKAVEINSLPADMVVYQKRIFLCSEIGLVEIPLKSKFPSKMNARFWEEIRKITTLPIVQMTPASYGYLLLAAMSGGVWQYALADYGEKERLRCLSQSHCSFVDRNFNDFVASSFVSGAYLVERTVNFGDEIEENDEGEAEPRPRKAEAKSFASLEEWFGKPNGFYFSQSYVVYCISDGKIYSSSKNHILKKEIEREDSIVEYDVSLPDETVKDARAEVFGVVIEYADKIVVLFADGQSRTILFGGRKLTSWRTFPGSKNYLNQLHLIFEDEIDIYSFNGPAMTSRRVFGFDYKFMCVE